MVFGTDQKKLEKRFADEICDEKNWQGVNEMR